MPSMTQVNQLAARAKAMREKHLELSTRLLAFARHVYSLEARFALYTGRG